MCCHEMNHLHAIIRYHFFDFDVCVVIFNVSYIESFYEKYSMFGKSKILCMSFSVIETYDQISEPRGRGFGPLLLLTRGIP